MIFHSIKMINKTLIVEFQIWKSLRLSQWSKLLCLVSASDHCLQQRKKAHISAQTKQVEETEWKNKQI